MRNMVEPTPGNECGSRDIEFRYDARAHLDWVLDQSLWIGRVGVLRGQGEAGRKAGLPWREQAITEIEGDQRRIEEWVGAHRQLAYVLPPKLRDLVPLLVLGPSVQIDNLKSRTLTPAQAVRLREICLKALTVLPRDPDERKADQVVPLEPAERKYKERMLRRLDPIGTPIPRVANVMTETASAPVAVSATQAGEGLLVAHRPEPGYPVIGYTDATGDVVMPLPLPEPVKFSFKR